MNANAYINSLSDDDLRMPVRANAKWLQKLYGTLCATRQSLTGGKSESICLETAITMVEEKIYESVEYQE